MIIAFWGYNESYDNNPAAFAQQLMKWIDETKKQNYSGKGAPRIVLCSPIAHENLDSPNLPDGKANNARLMQYAGATEAAAAVRKIPYVDLFHASKMLYAKNKEPLTINGIHPNSLGNKLLAQHLVSKLMELNVSSDANRVESLSLIHI